MTDEVYSLQEIGEDEELLSFSSSSQEQACIGHLRGDFGRGTEFWTAWWDHHEELKGQEFKDELDHLVNSLRESGPLKDLRSMERFCREHAQARMSPKAGTEYYGFRVDTPQRRYYLRFLPLRGNYNFYIYCYQTDKFERAAELPPKEVEMSDKITVLVVEPMKPCRVQEIPNTLEAMGQVVGGRIESFSYQREAIISNEESKFLDLPLNRPLYDGSGTQIDMLRGTFFVAGVDGEHLTSLTDDQLQHFKALYDSIAAERPVAQEEIAAEAAMPDFAVACQISFRLRIRRIPAHMMRLSATSPRYLTRIRPWRNGRWVVWMLLSRATVLKCGIRSPDRTRIRPAPRCSRNSVCWMCGINWKGTAAK